MRSIINIVIDGNKNLLIRTISSLLYAFPSPPRCPRVFDLAFESLLRLKDV